MSRAKLTWVLTLILALTSHLVSGAEKVKSTKDELFQLDDEPADAAIESGTATGVTSLMPKDGKKGAASGIRWSGFLQEEVARTYKSPSHWSKVLTRAQLTGQGEEEGLFKWKISGRIDYDAVFDLTDHYSGAVRDDRRLNMQVRETYVDFNAANLEFRLGRQHIVWGEMVGLFFADVVSAKDTRQFILPEFEIQRIPQWAIRAEHFKDDWHSELIWIPYVSYDEFGAAGDEFFPSLIPAPGLGLQTRPEVKPSRSIGNSNAGIRIGRLSKGWDMAGFFYSSMDSTPHFTRTIENLPTPTVVYTPRHNRIWQGGATLAKDFGSFVLKGESIYTRGKNFSITDFADADGVAKQNLLDYVLGIEFGMREKDVKFNVQAFQRIFLNHISSLIPDKYESGASLLVSGKFGDIAPQVLLIHSLNQSDWLLRPSADWFLAPNLRLRGGFDIFSGASTGLFGQYANRDRAYLELRYSY
jgi:hypothetical protein